MNVEFGVDSVVVLMVISSSDWVDAVSEVEPILDRSCLKECIRRLVVR